MNFTEIFPRKSQFGFQARFARLVATGRKTTTIRAPRKREPECGDICRFWTWVGTPYRSAQWLIGYGIAVRVETIGLSLNDGKLRIAIGQSRQISGWHDENFCEVPMPINFYTNRDKADPTLTVDNDRWADSIAIADGFSNADDMRRWFVAHHGLPFIGTKIEWLRITSVDWPEGRKPEVFALPRFAELAKALALRGVGKP